jgi:hypothetical protein
MSTKLERTEKVKMVRKIAGGRQDLFGELIAPHLSPFSSIVRESMSSNPDADDIVQQASIKASHLAQFRCEASSHMANLNLASMRSGTGGGNSFLHHSQASRRVALIDLSAVDPTHHGSNAKEVTPLAKSAPLRRCLRNIGTLFSCPISEPSASRLSLGGWC